MAADAASPARSGSVLLEVCVDSVEAAIAAEAGGAHRLELCSSLVEGGVTPSVGCIGAFGAAVGRCAHELVPSHTPLLKRLLATRAQHTRASAHCAPVQVVKRVKIPVHVLVRPRGGDFVFTDDDLAVAVHDIEAARAAGASGVVVGALSVDGTVDEKATSAMIAAARAETESGTAAASVTFHRAIDVSRDLLEAVDTCASLGVDRILTSGGQLTAAEGAAMIKSMVHRAAGGVVILAGAGVRASNVAALLEATGVSEVHGSAREVVASPMEYRPPHPVPMGGEKFNTADSEFLRKVTSTAAVKQLVEALASEHRAVVTSTEASVDA